MEDGQDDVDICGHKKWMIGEIQEGNQVDENNHQNCCNEN